MTVFILNIENYPARGITLTEAFSSLAKAVSKMETIYDGESTEPLVYDAFITEEQGIYTCGWKHANKGQYQTFGTIVERELQ